MKKIINMVLLATGFACSLMFSAFTNGTTTVENDLEHLKYVDEGKTDEAGNKVLTPIAEVWPPKNWSPSSVYTMVGMISTICEKLNNKITQLNKKITTLEKKLDILEQLENFKAPSTPQSNKKNVNTVAKKGRRNK